MQLVNLDDAARAARRRLPRPIYDAITGGSGSESTLRANREGFDRWRLLPRTLVDVRHRDLSTEVFGERLSLPVMLAPAGWQRMVHRDAELAMARGAGAAGTGFLLSSVTSYPLEQVAGVATGPRWFQIYLPEERAEAEKLIRRVEEAGFSTLVVTVDTPMHAIRERDIRNRMTVPLRLRPGIVAACALRPRWAFDFLTGGVARGVKPMRRLPTSIREAGRAIARTGRRVTVADIEWIRSHWSGPLVLKGVLRADECDRIVDLGADGIVVSNHGGRQIDSGPSTIEVLPDIVEAVAGRLEVLIDGGFRRGTDVVKALALGAKAALIGRPMLYGLAIGGAEGVELVLDILRHEIDTAMGLLGCTTVTEIDRSVLRPAP